MTLRGCLPGPTDCRDVWIQLPVGIHERRRMRTMTTRALASWTCVRCASASAAAITSAVTATATTSTAAAAAAATATATAKRPLVTKRPVVNLPHRQFFSRTPAPLVATRTAMTTTTTAARGPSTPPNYRAHYRARNRDLGYYSLRLLWPLSSPLGGVNAGRGRAGEVSASRS